MTALMHRLLLTVECDSVEDVHEKKGRMKTEEVKTGKGNEEDRTTWECV